MSKVTIELKKLLDDEYIKNEIVDKIPSSRFKLIYDTKKAQIHDEQDLSNFVTNSKEFDEIFQTQKNHKYVYLLYHNKICAYVGKAVDIKGRLKSHLFKCSEKTNSKIKKVANLLKENNGNLTIEIVALDITPDYLYSAVEGILIKEFETTEQWNEKES
jgi:hypothetical protein